MGIAGKLDFVVVGCQKAGTTSLHGFFKESGAVNLPTLKETNYWDYLYEPDLSGYFELFEDVKPNQYLKGEVAPHYWLSEDAGLRLSKHFPDVKILVVIRSPVERAYSAYNMYRKGIRFREYTKQSFERTLFLESTGELEKNLLDNGNYSKFLRPFLSQFAPKNVLIVRFDSLVKNQESTLARIAEFVGIQPEHVKPQLRQENYAGIPKSKLVFAVMNMGFLSSLLRKVTKGIQIHSMIKALLLSPPAPLSGSEKDRLSKQYFRGHDLEFYSVDSDQLSFAGYRVL